MKYYIYARKSTDDEDRQILSIEAQLVELRAFATRENLTVVKEYVEAKTAKKPGRPLFNDLILQIERGRADGILAWHPDRLARNSVDGGKIIYLVDRGVIKDLKFPTYRFDDNAQGKFMLSIAFGQSKYYIDALSENIRRGIRLKLSKGIWPQWAPLGYLNDRRTRAIIKDEGKAPFIKRIFELYSTGLYSLSEIREKVNALGLKGRRQLPLIISQIQSLLKNPLYYGVFKFNGEMYEGTHEPIITKKLFDKCQVVMAGRAKTKKSIKQYVLRGFMRCGECGRMITAETQKGHNYYHCTKRYTKCKQKYIREEALAAQVKKIIQKVSLCDDWTAKILRELKKDKNADVQSLRPQQQNLQRWIRNTDSRMTRLIDMYLNGHIALEDYKKTKEKLIQKKKDYEGQLQDFAAGDINWFERARDFVISLNRAGYIANEGNLEAQKEFLRKIGSNFILKERRLYFSSEEPYHFFLDGPQIPSWRRGWDLNPGDKLSPVQLISSELRSAAPAPLRNRYSFISRRTLPSKCQA